MADDDQQIEIGLIAIFGFIDPIRARIAPKEDDLEDPAIALPGLACPRGRLGTFAKENFLDPLQLAALDIRPVIKRSEERCVGKECVSRCGYRCSQDN